MNKAKIECPECEKNVIVDLDDEKEVGCGDCGSHPAVECPECTWYIDLVFNEAEEIK